MYNILLVAQEKEDYGTLYKYMTTTNSQGHPVPVELVDDTALDLFVEDMLNNQGYSKSDFMVVTTKNYTVSADIS